MSEFVCKCKAVSRIILPGSQVDRLGGGGQQFLMRDDAAGAAVVQDERELVSIGRRVDDAERGARLENGEQAHDRFHAVVEENDNTIIAANAAGLKSSGCSMP